MGLDLLFGSFAQHAQVAQLVEHATENRSVGGSIPPLGTIPEPICEPGVRGWPFEPGVALMLSFVPAIRMVLSLTTMASTTALR